MISRQKVYNNLCSCPEDKYEKKRCPECGSLNTKKKGFTKSKIKTRRGEIKRALQRYVCKECLSSFCNQDKGHRKRITEKLKEKAVLEYICEKSSLREVARRYNVSATAINNWIEKVAKGIPLIEEGIKEHQWSGMIQFDGKEIRIQGRKKVIMTACDGITGMPINYDLVERENKEGTFAFLNKTKMLYPKEIKGITSDFGKGKCFSWLVEKIFESIPHQICLVHYHRYMWLFIPRTRRSKYFWRNAVLKGLIRNIIGASTRSESLKWLKKLKERKVFFKTKIQMRFYKSVIKNYRLLTAYYDHPELIKTTNVAENINRQIERKLKNMDGFKSEKTMVSFFRIWFYFYVKNRPN
jgi:transposase-like protein